MERVKGCGHRVPTGLEVGRGGLVILVEILAFGFERRDGLEQLIGLVLFFFREWRLFKMNLMKLFAGAVRNAGFEDGADPGVAAVCGYFGCIGLKLLTHDALGDLGVGDPGLAGVVGEQIAFDPVSIREVFGLGRGAGDRRTGFDRTVGDHPAKMESGWLPCQLFDSSLHTSI